MKVFIGTLESGEADFHRCLQALRTQELSANTTVHHYVVSGLNEQAAHARLYEEWNAAKSEFDLLLKVDADTVLASPGTIQAFIQLFESDPRVTGVQAWLHDYMTAGLIYGLTCVSNRVAISTAVDPLFCDRVDTGHDRIVRGDAIKSLALSPAGFHCHHSSEMQAFRYGLHRAKKGQFSIRERVRNAWHAAGRDRIRGMALLGFEAANVCVDIDYAAPGFKHAFSRACVEIEKFCQLS